MRDFRFDNHIHTMFSNIRGLDAITKIDNLIDYAIEIGLKGISITDHETVSAHIDVLNYVEKIKSEARKVIDSNTPSKKIKTISQAKDILDFKVGLGNEIYLCRDGLNKENYIKGEDGYFHFILVAKDKEGHKQIRELSSIAWSHHFRQFVERVPTYYKDVETIIGKNKGHVIASTACLGGQLAKMILAGQDQKAINFINWCKNVFGEENFFLELQPNGSEEQLIVNNKLVDLSAKTNTKCIITTDTHYLKKEDRPIHKAYLNSNESEREVDAFYADTYLMSSEEIHEKMDYLGEDVVSDMLRNSLDIYNAITEYSLNHTQIIPRIPMKDYDKKSIGEVNGIDISKNEYTQKFLNSESLEDRFFMNHCIEKLVSLELADIEHFERLEQEAEEMWIVSDKIEERLSAYFITVQKIIDIAWTEGDTLVGPWRGSAGAMLTAYLMDIVQRDPLKSPAPLPYWRFCSRGRAELADIDIDTQASKREKFIKAVEKYFTSIGGELTTVATFGTETSKAALNTSCRGLGHEPELGTYLSSLVPVDRGFVRSLKQCYYGDEEKGLAPIPLFVKEMNIHKDVWEVAQAIEGLISRRGTHASGVIITNGKFTDLGATMVSPKGLKCSQWALHQEEQAG